MANRDAEQFQRLCKLRELFHGRFTEEEGATLLTRYNGSLQETVAFILTRDPTEVRAAIQEEDESWTQVKRKIRQVKRDRPDLLARARTGLIDTATKQFACSQCDHMWWRRTPDRKQVSKCNICRHCYEPLPLEKMWGWAEFKCTQPGCDKEFGGFVQMGVPSPCYNCGHLVYPTRIVPPSERQRNTRHARGQYRNTQHVCMAFDCAGRGPGHGPGDPRFHCAHPNTRRRLGLPLVVTGSRPHDCSGSTVATFLPQNDLSKTYEQFFPTLPPVNEIDDGDGSDVSSN